MKWSAQQLWMNCCDDELDCPLVIGLKRIMQLQLGKEWQRRCSADLLRFIPFFNRMSFLQWQKALVHSRQCGPPSAKVVSCVGWLRRLMIRTRSSMPSFPTQTATFITSLSWRPLISILRPKRLQKRSIPPPCKIVRERMTGSQLPHPNQSSSQSLVVITMACLCRSQITLRSKKKESSPHLTPTTSPR